MRDAAELLKDLLSHLVRIEPKRTLGLEEFTANSDARDAVLYNLIIIGEIVKTLPAELLSRHADYDWSKVARFRDRVIHAYQNTDDVIVWDTLRNSLPDLKAKVMQMLAELEPPSDVPPRS